MRRFSARAPEPSAPNPLTRALESRRAQGAEILDLTVSNPSACGLGWPPTTLARALSGVDAASYRPEPLGLFDARVVVCAELATYGIAATPERVMLTASTSEAYAFILKLLCDAGDRIAAPTPGYPLLDTLARLEGVGVAPFRFRYDGEWRVDAQTLRAATVAPTRAIALVHPNNPTGAFVAREDVALVRSLGLPVVSDEVFSEYVWRNDSNRLASLLDRENEALVFRLGGLSKSAALPQLKLAWTVVGGPDAAVRDALARLEHIADAYLSASSPVQLALPTLLAEASAIRERVKARCRANLDALDAACCGSPLTLLSPDAGWSAVIRLPAVCDDETWSLLFLEKAGVFVHPGYFYDFESGAYAVVSLLTEPEVFTAGIGRVLSLVR